MDFLHQLGTMVALLVNDGSALAAAIAHNFPALDDHRIFANRVVETSAQASRLQRLPSTFVSDLAVPDERGVVRPLTRYLDETQTASFVVLRDDRIVYERYSRGHDETSLFNSFSIAKAILGTLVGIALAEGRIESLEATVARYRPDLAATSYGNVTLKSLVMMTSGVGEPPSLLPGRAQYYYGGDLRAVVSSAAPDSRPANGWRYSEADAQVLGMVLEAAVGMRISDYLAAKLWKPLGMESPALWALDRPGGDEKAFCCISARARDFARFGLLYLRGGRWNGTQIIPATWTAHAALPGVVVPDGYTHRQLWWIPEGGRGDYYAYGHSGQYVYINPEARVVIVKFSETSAQDPLPMFRAVAESLR